MHLACTAHVYHHTCIITRASSRLSSSKVNPLLYLCRQLRFHVRQVLLLSGVEGVDGQVLLYAVGAERHGLGEERKAIDLQGRTGAIAKPAACADAWQTHSRCDTHTMQVQYVCNTTTADGGATICKTAVKQG